MTPHEIQKLKADADDARAAAKLAVQESGGRSDESY
jgi:hypothetical protein